MIWWTPSESESNRVPLLHRNEQTMVKKYHNLCVTSKGMVHIDHMVKTQAGSCNEEEIKLIDHIGKTWANLYDEKIIKHIGKTLVGWRFKLSNQGARSIAINLSTNQMMICKKDEAYISNQVRIHVCYLILNHCIIFL